MNNYNTLTQAGIIAIPLLYKQESGLAALTPNYFVIDSQDSRKFEQVLDINTNEIVSKYCIEIKFKIVFREILAATPTTQEEFIERLLFPSESISIPVEMLPLLFTHQSIKNNLQIVNLALSKFRFRGVLSDLVLQIDEVKLDEIIANSVLV